ncbi:2-dehydropantoate 2-reductase [Sphingomonas sp.]|uniref:2-dehydropantoate 2-reductase n=1 Tax=Sphingomonas sp. TaxID=28214 RepID=UPI003D6C7A3F
MKIGIVGAGAIGGWLGVRLARSGHAVSVLARGDTLAALSDRAWRLEIGGETLDVKVRASERAEALGPQDVVFVTVKGPALPALARTLTPLVGADTIVVPAMNGVPWWFLLGGGGELSTTPLASVDPDGAITSAIPLDRVLGCVVHAAATLRGPGNVIHKAGNRLILGEPSGAASPRLDAVADALIAAGFDVERSDRIRYDIWYKLWGNMTMNPISAITAATCDKVLDDPLVAAFALRAMAEAQAIGARIGCAIPERGEDRNAVTRQLGAFKTSMLQDAEAGRPLEIDQLIAAPREIARMLAMDTPNIDALLGLTRLFAQTKDLYPRSSRASADKAPTAPIISTDEQLKNTE